MTSDAELRDRTDVAELMLRYARGIDDKDMELFRTCFTADAEFLGFAREPVRGIDDWVAFVRKTIDRYASTQHMLGPPHVELDGDRASARTDLRALHVPHERGETPFTLWGVYWTTMVRQDEWRIAEHRLDVRHVEGPFPGA